MAVKLDMPLTELKVKYSNFVLIMNLKKNKESSLICPKPTFVAVLQPTFLITTANARKSQIYACNLTTKEFIRIAFPHS